MTTLNQDFILSEVAPSMGRVHHPWEMLRDRLPDWDVVWRRLPPGQLGGTDADEMEIVLDPRQHQRQRRCTLDHEIIHAEAGDVGCQSPQRELEIDIASARRLIPIHTLLTAVVWAHDLEELADECWVDLATVQCRLEHLHPSERAAVKRALAARDYHEEGMT